MVWGKERTGIDKVCPVSMWQSKLAVFKKVLTLKFVTTKYFLWMRTNSLWMLHADECKPGNH